MTVSHESRDMGAQESFKHQERCFSQKELKLLN